MENIHQNQPDDLPHDSVEFRTVPKSSEEFGTIRHTSETFRTLPNASEKFLNIPNSRGDNHTLTVREVARLFEAAGVARTERSIINWCQPGKMGVARLDNYFDPNERKYFISPQSVEAAIEEEKAKSVKGIQAQEGERNLPKDSETLRNIDRESDDRDEARVSELQKEITDLKIANRGKDYFIEQLKNERDGFGKERQDYVEKLMIFSRRVGELETKVLRLEAPTMPRAEESDASRLA